MFGIVLEATGKLKWKVRWDNGKVTENASSNVLSLAPPGAGYHPSSPSHPNAALIAAGAIFHAQPDEPEETGDPQGEGDPDDGDPTGDIDVHAQTQNDAQRAMAALVGTPVTINSTGKPPVDWTVVSEVKEQHQDIRSSLAGMKFDFSTVWQESDVWGEFYPRADGLTPLEGIMKDLETLNNLAQEQMPRGQKWKLVTPHEWVRFWGMIYAAIQHTQRGKDLYNTTNTGRVSAAANFALYMPRARFEEIRHAVRYAKCNIAGIDADPWARADGFRARAVHSLFAHLHPSLSLTPLPPPPQILVVPSLTRSLN